MNLHELSPAAGSNTKAYRKGRGAGSGNGKTGGRGQKGDRLGAGFGDDLRRLVLSLPDQTVGFGTAFLQPLVVELFGQLLKFVFHSVI